MNQRDELLFLFDSLPPAQQQTVIDFAAFLKQKYVQKKPVPIQLEFGSMKDTFERISNDRDSSID